MSELVDAVVNTLIANEIDVLVRIFLVVDALGISVRGVDVGVITAIDRQVLERAAFGEVVETSEVIVAARRVDEDIESVVGDDILAAVPRRRAGERIVGVGGSGRVDNDAVGVERDDRIVHIRVRAGENGEIDVVINDRRVVRVDSRVA